MRDPPVGVSAGLRVAPELGVKDSLISDRRPDLAAPPCAEFDQFAVLLLDSVRVRTGAPQLGHCFAFGRNHGLAFVAQLGKRLAPRAGGLPLLGVCLSVIQIVLADVGHHAETQVIPGVVEDQAIGLARRYAQPPADPLNEGHSRFGRPGIDDAGRHRKIDADLQRRD